MSTTKTVTLSTGTVLQNGIPKSWGGYGLNPMGLMVRGVVLASFVSDDDNAPVHGGHLPVGVYCDVWVYSTIPSLETQVLFAVPVMQDRGGLHDGRIWKPKAAQRDMRTGADFRGDLIEVSPADLDGDHVLIGFMDRALNRPIILGGVPHPAVDKGKEKNRSEDTAIGFHRNLKVVDGDPDYLKYRGTLHGVDGNGNHIIDSTYAYDGTLTDDGKEPGRSTDAKGSQIRRIPENAEHRVEVHAADAVVLAFEQFLKDKKVISIDGGATQTVEGKDGAAKLVLGDGSVSMAIAERLAELWASMVSTVNAWGVGHIHPTAWGPSGPSAGPPAPLNVPSWNTNINSTHLKTPNL